MGSLIYSVSPSGGSPEKIDSIADGAVYWIGQSESDGSLVFGRDEWLHTVWVGGNQRRQTGIAVISNEADVVHCAIDYRKHREFELS